MLRLGPVVKRAKPGLLLVEFEGGKLPRLGARVYDSSRNLVGSVADIIGPVERPFIVIKPREGAVLEEGMVLYVEAPRPRRGRGRRPGRGKRPGRRRRGGRK